MTRTGRTVHTDLKRVGLDTSKAVFTLQGVDHEERAVLRRNLKRANMASLFAKLPPTRPAEPIKGRVPVEIGLRSAPPSAASRTDRKGGSNRPRRSCSRRSRLLIRRSIAPASPFHGHPLRQARRAFPASVQRALLRIRAAWACHITTGRVSYVPSEW